LRFPREPFGGCNSVSKRLRGGRSVVGRTVGLIGAVHTYAVRQGHRIDNPTHGVVKIPLANENDDEYRMLGMALSKADAKISISGVNPIPAASTAARAASSVAAFAGFKNSAAHRLLRNGHPVLVASERNCAYARLPV
jgi:hypothetical protein